MEVNKDLRQRHIDAYFPLMRDVSADKINASEYSGCVVRAAVKAGIITGLTPEEVDDLKPGLVIKLTRQVNEAIVEALTVPPD